MPLHTLPEALHVVPCSVPLDDRSNEIGLPLINNEHRCHARDEVKLTSSLASHPQVFHGGCFGVYGTPPGEAVSCCQNGTMIPRIPRLDVGISRIQWLRQLTFGRRVQTCLQVLRWRL